LLGNEKRCWFCFLAARGEMTGRTGWRRETEPVALSRMAMARRCLVEFRRTSQTLHYRLRQGALQVLQCSSRLLWRSEVVGVRDQAERISVYAVEFEGRPRSSRGRLDARRFTQPSGDLEVLGKFLAEDPVTWWKPAKRHASMCHYPAIPPISFVASDLMSGT